MGFIVCAAYASTRDRPWRLVFVNANGFHSLEDNCETAHYSSVDMTLLSNIYMCRGR